MRGILGSLPDQVSKALVQPFTGLAQQVEKLLGLAPDERSAATQQILQQPKAEQRFMESSAESVHQQLQSDSDKCGAFWDKSNTIHGGLVEQLNDVTDGGCNKAPRPARPAAKTSVLAARDTGELGEEIADLENEIGSLQSSTSDYEKAHSVMKWIPGIPVIVDEALKPKRDELHAREEMQRRKNRDADELQNRLDLQPKHPQLLHETAMTKEVLDIMTSLKDPIGDLKGQFESLQGQLGQLQNDIMAAKHLQVSVFAAATAEGEASML